LVSATPLCKIPAAFLGEQRLRLGELAPARTLTATSSPNTMRKIVYLLNTAKNNRNWSGRWGTVATKRSFRL